MLGVRMMVEEDIRARVVGSEGHIVHMAAGVRTVGSGELAALLTGRRGRHREGIHGHWRAVSLRILGRHAQQHTGHSQEGQEHASQHSETREGVEREGVGRRGRRCEREKRRERVVRERCDGNG